MKDEGQGPPARPAPLQVAPIRPVVRADPDADAVLDEILQEPVDALELVEFVEDQADDLLDLLVGVEGELAGGELDVADRRADEQLAAHRLVPPPLIEAALEEVGLRLRQGPLHPQEQPIIIFSRVVEAVLVGQQGLEQGAHLQQVVPVLAGAGQAAHLPAEDQADVIHRHIGQEALEAGSPLGRLGAVAEVLIDDDDAVARPSPGDGVAGQVVLQGGGLAVAGDLVEGGLAHVDDGQSLDVAGPDLGRWPRQRLCRTRPLRSPLVRSLAGAGRVRPGHRGPPFVRRGPRPIARRRCGSASGGFRNGSMVGGSPRGDRPGRGPASPGRGGAVRVGYLGMSRLLIRVAESPATTGPIPAGPAPAV